jgi:sodium:sulfate symporter-like transmembrane protein
VYAQVVSACRVFFIAGCFDFISATIFGTGRGLVHDPQHRPVAAAQVVLKAKASAFALTAQSDANREFHFDSVITPFADAASPIYAHSGYLSAGDYWRLGMILAAIFLGVLLLPGVPWARNTLGAVAVRKSVRTFLIQDGFAGGEIPSRFIL